jgi:hypothetical protein
MSYHDDYKKVDQFDLKIEIMVVAMLGFGWMLMCEFFFCRQLKYSTVFTFLTFNMGVRLWLI